MAASGRGARHCSDAEMEPSERPPDESSDSETQPDNLQHGSLDSCCKSTSFKSE